MKYSPFLLLSLLVLPFSSFAEGELSDTCLSSVRNLYRFYYHDIEPNPKKEACKKASEKISPQEALEMQVVIGELRTHCPANLIAKITQSLSTEPTQG